MGSLVRKGETHLNGFNAGFGITYKADGGKSAKKANIIKFGCSIPLLGLFVAILYKTDKKVTSAKAKNAVLARGILCGLGVGIPIVLALDIIASVSTQIHQWRQLKSRKVELVPVENRDD